MSKSPIPPRRTRAPKKPVRKSGPNPRLGEQTRKFLSQHYRAKHGVR